MNVYVYKAYAANAEEFKHSADIGLFMKSSKLITNIYFKGFRTPYASTQVSGLAQHLHRNSPRSGGFV